MRLTRLVRWLILIAFLAIVGRVVAHFVFWSPRNVGYTSDRVIVIAHRGASEAAPENTLAAFRKAIELGADSFELDVMLSKDEQVVILHDDTVDRTTNGSGNVRDMTVAQLKELDAGSWFAPEFTGERVPTLQEAMEVAKGRSFIEIELKPQGVFPTGLESAVADLIEKNGMEDSVVVTSFNPFQLFYLRLANSNIPTGLLYKSDLPLPLRDRWLASLAHPDGMRPSSDMSDASHIQQLKSRGHQVIAWTANEPDEMRRLIGAGVDGIITDAPDVLRQVLYAR